MKKTLIYLLWLCLSLASAMAETSSSKRAFGFLSLTPSESPYKLGLYSFDIEKADSLSLVFEIPKKKIISGAFAKGYYYVCAKNENETSLMSNLLRIDPQSGAETQIADLKNLTKNILDLSYHYTSNLMYALEGPSKLVSINLETGNISLVKEFNGMFLLALAIHPDGSFYFLDYTGKLWTLKNLDSEPEKVGSSSISPSGLQSMEFDIDSELLYCTSYNGYTGYFYKIDPLTASSTRLASFGDFMNMVGLHLPYDESGKKKPAGVRNLVGAASENGLLEAKISWKNPMHNASGQVLDNLSSIKIYRNDSLIHEQNTQDTSASLYYTDYPKQAGLYTYKLTACNSHGEGIPLSVLVYVGEDTPIAPQNIKIKIINKSPYISWSSVKSGVHAAYISPDKIKYDIVRFPGNVEVANAITDTFFTDSYISDLNAYTYKVRATHLNLPGAFASSAPIRLGESIRLPFDCPISDSVEFSLFDIIDHNKDNYSWQYRNFEDLQASYAFCRPNFEKNSDDYFVSEKVFLEAGKIYKIRFDLLGDNLVASEKLMKQNIRVLLGKEKSVEALNTELSQFTSYISGSKEARFKVDESDYFHIAIHDFSEKSLGGTHLKNFKLELVNLVDIACLSLSTNDSVIGTEIPACFTYKIKNVGLNSINQYEVQLLNESGDTLKSKTVSCSIAVEAEISDTIQNTWKTSGVENVFVKIILEDEEFKDNNTAKLDYSLHIVPSYVVSGSIFSENKAVNHVFVRSEGNYASSTWSDEEGKFNIRLLSANGYRLLFEKRGLQRYIKTFDLKNSDLRFDSIHMPMDALSVTDLKAELQENSLTLRWKDGSSYQIHRYDSDLVGGYWGPNSYSPYTFIGSAFYGAMELEQIQWVSDDASGGNPNLNFFIFALDKNGNILTDSIFKETNVPNMDSRFGSTLLWNTHKLSQPLSFEYGCLIAMNSENNFFGTYLSSPNPKYPFTQGVSYIAEDYTKEIKKTDDFIGHNFFIRAGAIPKYQSKHSLHYFVYRLLEGQENNKNSWIKLNPEPLKDLFYTDQNWSELPQGKYKYAIETAYPQNKFSEMTISEAIYKDMYTSISGSLQLNTLDAKEDIELALVPSKANEKTLYTLSDLNGQFHFDSIEKGDYHIEVRSANFDYYQSTRKKFDTQSNYQVDDITLSKRIPYPIRLEITGNTEAGEKWLKWNIGTDIFEDFEDYKDFTINPGGKFGWKPLDLDFADSYGLQDYNWPQQGEKMAYCIFNPKTSSPSLNDYFKAYSGDKFLGFLSSAAILGNEDYFISPSLHFAGASSFSFYARATIQALGTEKMKVGYSFTDHHPESFTYLKGAGDPENPDVFVLDYEWKRYSFKIPSGVKYVCIVCVSQESFMLMIDDVNIEGTENVEASHYNIYIDHQKIGESKQMEYRLPLLNNTHTIGVEAVFTEGRSKISEIIYNPTKLDVNTENSLSVYPNPVKNKLFIEGEFEDWAFYDLQGKCIIQSDKNKKQKSLSTAEIKNGLYLLKIRSHTGYSIHKILIQH